MKARIDKRHAFYYIARAPQRMKPHNALTWKGIERALGLAGKASYDQLVALSQNHESGSKTAPHPYQFIDYCIGKGWLVRIDE